MPAAWGGGGGGGRGGQERSLTAPKISPPARFEQSACVRLDSFTVKSAIDAISMHAAGIAVTPDAKATV